MKYFDKLYKGNELEIFEESMCGFEIKKNLLMGTI